MDHIALADLPRHLADLGYQPIPYKRVYNRVLDGVLPAERAKNGRWLVRRDDAHLIADRLGLRLDNAA